MENKIDYMRCDMCGAVFLARRIVSGNTRLYQSWGANGWEDDDYAFGMFTGEEDGEATTEEQVRKDIEANKKWIESHKK